ncbi:potassium-transporting ATPase subunit KdpA [Rhizomicrobium electricum]|uniref:Potassium-transporting ATPase potassium-binding subunit n=1 Tax=Rhizomicrobium electricum TaxID=480070 RepID=A0ABN1EW25_9PROT|nr:potassium-transporting ATPase subunit KdpA [Rhizomicrobium electricum]NIJ50055.1 K+-transporting ATPase ATPase A chain [Rhizomicrobium electricum]
MTANAILQIVLFAAAVTLTVKPLGAYMAAVFEGRRTVLSPVFAPVERLLYRAAGLNPSTEQHWTAYALAMLAFSVAGLVLLYAILRLQAYLPFNPQGLPNVPADLAFNTAVSFVTNTNWQSYAGETTLSYFSQMVGLTMHNFVSAATGIALAIALIRGFARRSAKTVGNFWVDLVRATLYVLLPLALVMALVLIGQGVPQNFSAYTAVTTLEGLKQTLAQGPVASQEAIKMIGTNGGGFFNANSAHPFENPTAITNFIELWSILAISAALTHTFGRMVGNTRQGWAIFAVMGLLWLGGQAVCSVAEYQPSVKLAALHVDQTPNAQQAGGNMEGKEVRFGIVNSTLWAVATTDASNGSVNAMHDSFTPLGGLVPMFNIELGEIVFGGVGSGLYGMLLFAILAMFVAGLMVGRTPEYLGKKLEAREVKMAILAILVTPLATLIPAAIASVTPAGLAGLNNAGPHGFSEILYAFSSAAGNNGSAFAGLTANTTFYNLTLAVAMLLGRFLWIVPMLAVAGSLAAKKIVPASEGTFPTTGPLFVGLLTGVVLIVGGLTFFPALALGPLAEHFAMHAGALY